MVIFSADPSKCECQVWFNNELSHHIKLDDYFDLFTFLFLTWWHQKFIKLLLFLWGNCIYWPRFQSVRHVFPQVIRSSTTTSNSATQNSRLLRTQCSQWNWVCTTPVQPCSVSVQSNCSKKTWQINGDPKKRAVAPCHWKEGTWCHAIHQQLSRTNVRAILWRTC